MIADLARDVRFAARSLARSPGFVTAAVLSLGLAIGAGISGFAVLDAVRFRALPFPNADRLYLISEAPAGGCPSLCDVANTTFAIIKDHQPKSIDALTAFYSGVKSLGTGETQVDVPNTLINRSALEMFGVKPELGRNFTEDEDKLGGPRLLLIGHDLWMSYFSGDSSVIGKVVTLSDESYTIIGVMPKGFVFETRSVGWLAASQYFDPRTGTSVRSSAVLARLAPGATPQDLIGELRTLEAAANELRPPNQKTTFSVAPFRTRFVDATRSQDLIFAGIVVAILLIACANVAGLVLVRAIRQLRELAIRGALGAGRGALARHLILQNALLALAGLGLGFVVAAVTVGALRASAPLPALRVPGMEYRLDARAIGFAVLLSALVTLALSLAPFRLLARTNLQRILREGSLSTTSSRGGNRTQQILVIVQTACAVALLVGTGLMIRTALRFRGIPVGYDAERVAYVTPIPAHAGRVKSWYLPLSEHLLTDYAAMPGVEFAAVRAQVPLGVPKAGEPVTVILDDGTTLTPEVHPRFAYGVSPDYFSVMGVAVTGGRAFQASDDENAGKVAIVNEWAARRWWPKGTAVGRTFSVDTAPGARAVLTVVGVVRDNLATAGNVLLAKPGPEVYRPYRQANFWISTYFARTKGQPARLVEPMQKDVMRRVPNGKPTGGVLAEQVEAQVASVESNVARLAGFGVIGLLLAITGLYGVLSYLVQQRTQEMGIRAVLGAQRRDIVSLVMGNAVRLTLIGVLLGFGLAAVATRFMQSVLFGTPGADVGVYGAVAVLLAVVALAAGYFPARRAASVDPAVALRGG